MTRPPGEPTAPAGPVRPAGPSRAATRSWRLALSLFTVIPAGADPELRRETAAAALLWLPAVGLLTGAGAAAVLAAAELGRPSAGRQLLAAVLAVAAVAAVTGGLHLDGLADTADGLGSRRPAAEALAIMRRPDTGPMGVVALVLVLAVQISALATIAPGRISAGALILALVTGRVAVLLAAAGSAPAARQDGLGALVAGTVSWRTAALAVTGLLAAAGAAGAVAGTGAGPGPGGLALAARGLAAALAGLLAGYLLRRTALRRLGGLTGDVLGAICEISAAVTLAVIALSG
jgi:adenosylcobinamide-GDP ribazoletransferase